MSKLLAAGWEEVFRVGAGVGVGVVIVALWE